MTAVIHAEGLGKRYRRGVVVDDALRHALDRLVRAPLEVFRRPKQETFWALKDVSVDIHEGEVVGLIGRNGSGKTTLLKLLSRITRPTEGWAEIHGRVRSLLEVGTGFHGELTGRENTYLSGSILGMSKREIDRKLDDIIAFAEIEKFIDTPVKHYSSGMYVRLAFAVAAHLEPEILLVDEVLAVGDINFQKKCLGKMGDVARAGRTVVLVSHQLNQIRRLCHRAIWVDGGSVRMNGKTHEVVSAYEAAMASGDRSNGTRSVASNGARFLGWSLDGSGGDAPHVLTTLGPTTVTFQMELGVPVRHGQHGVALFNAERQLIWATAEHELQLEPGIHAFSHSFPMLPLKPGLYQWQASLWDDVEMLELWDCVPEMSVATENFQHPMDQWNGVLNVPSKFAVRNGRNEFGTDTQ